MNILTIEEDSLKRFVQIFTTGVDYNNIEQVAFTDYLVIYTSASILSKKDDYVKVIYEVYPLVLTNIIIEYLVVQSIVYYEILFTFNSHKYIDYDLKIIGFELKIESTFVGSCNRSHSETLSIKTQAKYPSVKKQPDKKRKNASLTCMYSIPLLQEIEVKHNTYAPDMHPCFVKNFINKLHTCDTVFKDDLCNDMNHDKHYLTKTLHLIKHVPNDSIMMSNMVFADIMYDTIKKISISKVI